MLGALVQSRGRCLCLGMADFRCNMIDRCSDLHVTLFCAFWLCARACHLPVTRVLCDRHLPRDRQQDAHTPYM
jgi:hypothetical protein